MDCYKINGQRGVQNDQKLCSSYFISQEPYIMWLPFMVHLCKMIILLGIFFQLFKILIFWVHIGIKEQKTVHNDKRVCLSHSISQEPHIIWLRFMVKMWKIIISLGVFFNVKILIFLVVKELNGEQIVQNCKNFCLLHLII